MGGICGGDRPKEYNQDLFIKVAAVQGLSYPLEWCKNLFIRCSVTGGLSLDTPETKALSDSLSLTYNENLSIKIDPTHIQESEKYHLNISLFSKYEEEKPEILIGQTMLEINEYLSGETWINRHLPLISIGEKIKIMGVVYLKGKYYKEAILEEEIEKNLGEIDNLEEKYQEVLEKNIKDVKLPKRFGKFNLVFKAFVVEEEKAKKFWFEIVMGDEKFSSEEIEGQDEIVIENINFNFEIGFEAEEKNKKFFEIVCYKKENGENSVVGKKQINLERNIKEHGNWIEDKIVEFDNGSLVFNSRFKYNNYFYRNSEYKPEDDVLEVENVEGEEGAAEKTEGSLLVNIVNCENLFNTDADIGEAADPFVEMKLNFTSEKHFTCVRQRNLNPVWNYRKNIKLKITEKQLKDGEISLKVWDMDKVGQDFMGEANIKLESTFEKACFWQNHEIELTGKGLEGKTLGKIFVHTAWKPKGMKMKNIEDETFLSKIRNFDLSAEIADIGERFVEAKEKFKESISNLNMENAKTAIMEALKNMQTDLMENKEEIIKEIVERVKTHETYNPEDREGLKNLVIDQGAEVLAKYLSATVSKNTVIAIPEAVISFVLKNQAPSMMEKHVKETQITEILKQFFGYKGNENDPIEEEAIEEETKEERFKKKYTRITTKKTMKKHKEKIEKNDEKKEEIEEKKIENKEENNKNEEKNEEKKEENEKKE